LKEFALLLTASFFHFFDIFFCLAVVEGRVKVTMSWSLNTLQSKMRIYCNCNFQKKYAKEKKYTNL